MKNKHKNIFLAILITVFSLPVHAVVIDGKDWADFNSFTGVTFNSVNVSFNKDTGECRSGSCVISGIDLTGYKWATSSEIFGLLTNYGASGTFNSNTSENYSILNSSFFTDFTSTSVATMSRDYNISTVDYFSMNGTETYFGNGGARTYKSYNGIGHAFYKEAASGGSTTGSVPEPATLALFALGLLGVRLTRGKKSPEKNHAIF